MSQTGLKTGDLDLFLQGQITFKLELCIDHLKVLDYCRTGNFDDGKF